MKNLIIAFVITGSIANAQIQLPKDSSGKIIYAEVVQVTDASKDKYDERQTSETMFKLIKNFNSPTIGKFSLLEAQLVTGRTHQLRVQLAHLGFVIVGDDKYGDFALNKALVKHGLKRMFLHSSVTKIRHPLTSDKLELAAPMPAELSKFLQKLES